ncbi:MAG: DUF1579 family protein [bacterium]
MKRLLPVVILLLPMVSAFGQDIARPKEISDLAWMVGAWEGSGKIAFGGQETEITTSMTVSFDGQFLKSVSSDKSSGFTLTKTSMLGWDATKSQYVSYTFTNMAPTARIAHGKLEGGKLVMTSDPWEAEGMTAVMKETVSNVSDTKCGYKLELKTGEKWATGMDFVLNKK